MVTTSWCGPTAFPRHGPIDAALPAVASSPLCSLVVTCWVQKEKTGFKKHEWALYSVASSSYSPLQNQFLPRVRIIL
jgi:hypothetical protein